MPLAFVIADVFTATPLTGNQLAVFTDATDIDASLLQPIAREIGFSETVYVYPDDRVRIFTPDRELPFAGHPVLGTAHLLATSRRAREVTLQTGVGPVRLTFDERGRGRMVQPLPSVAQWDGDSAALHDALGVARSGAPIDVYDNGIRHLFVVLDEPAAVAALRPDGGRIATLVPDSTLSCIAGTGTEWKSRMFAPAFGVTEDPATGSAAGPLAVHVCRHGLAEWGAELTVTQGVEIARPSTLYAVARGSDDRLDAVEVAGDTVVVGRGTFEL